MASVIKPAVPPGPTDSASEQVRRWIESPVEFWEECHHRYGSVVALDLGSLGPVMLLTEPEHVRQVFQLPPDRFECHQYNEHYRYVMGDNAVLVQDGETHMRQRRLLGPPFRLDQLLPLAPVVRDIVRRGVATWPVGESFNPRPDLHEITFRVMLHLILGTDDGETARHLLDIHRDAVARQVGSWGPWRNFARLQPRIRALLASEIRARRDDPGHPGLLTRIANGRDAGGELLTDAECEDHVFSLMIAGVDTSAVSLAWALHWLGRDVGVCARLDAELAERSERSAGAGAPAEDGSDLRELPYLHAVYSETVRMYPIVPTPSGRRLTEDTTIGEHLFAAGTTLVPCGYLVHRREELFPDGDRFIPDRFLGRRFQRHEYFPFGGGVRSCVGEMLAQLEFKIALATILERWAILPDEGPPARPVRHGTLLAPAEHFRIRVRPVARRSAARGTT
jgi:cytochrome P450 family 110